MGRGGNGRNGSGVGGLAGGGVDGSGASTSGRMVDLDRLFLLLSRGGGGGGGGGNGGGSGGGNARRNNSGGGGGGRGTNGGPRGGQGGGGNRGGGFGNGGRTDGVQTVRGDGEWACGQCGFLRNFARRTVCLGCGAARGQQRQQPGAGGTRGGAPTARGGKGSAPMGTSGGPGGGGKGGGKGVPGPQRGGQPTMAAAAVGGVLQRGPPAHGLRPQPLGPPPAFSRGGRYTGPVGPDGKRPLLSSSWAGIAARAPPQAGGGAALGPASSASGGGSTTQRAADEATVARGAARGPVVDAEGFTLVVGKGKGRRPREEGNVTSHPAGDSGEQVRAWDPPPTETAPAADGEGGGTAPGDQQADAGDLGQETFEDAVEDGPTVSDLRDQMDRDKEAVEYLVQRGYGEGHPLLEAAQAQAAASKAHWQNARPGVAVTQRMLWAEKALARAKKAQAKMEQAIDDLDREYEAERESRVQQLHSLRERTKERESKLASVSREAAEEFQGAGGGQADGQLQEAFGTIDGPLRDAVSEALASAPEGSALRTRLAGALGSLDSLRGLVERVARPRWADVYDMAEDDGDQWGECGGDDTYGGYGGHRQAWYTPHTYQDQSWGGDGDGWQEASAWGHGDCRHADDAMDTGDVQVPTWWSPAPHTDTAPARAWQRRKLNDEDAGGMQGRHIGGDDAGVTDHANAARLQAATNDAASTAQAEPAPPTPNLADQALERRKQEVWDLAQDQNVQVTVGAIASMASEELEEWATKYLL